MIVVYLREITSTSALIGDSSLALPDVAIIPESKGTFNSGLSRTLATWVLSLEVFFDFSSWFWRSFCYYFNDSMPSPYFLFQHAPWRLYIFSLFGIFFLGNPNANHFSEIWVSPVTCHRPRFHQVSDPNTEQLFIFGSCTEFLVGAEQAVIQKHNGRCVIFRCHYLLTLVQTFTVVFWNFLLNLISCGAIAFNSIYYIDVYIDNDTWHSIQKLEQLHVCRHPYISCKHLPLVTCHWRTFPSWRGTTSSLVIHVIFIEFVWIRYVPYMH